MLRVQVGRLPRAVAIHVEPDGRVLVDAPEGISGQEAKVAVKKRARWISKQLEAIRARRAHVLPREHVSGEAITYLGRRYRLKVIRNHDRNPTVRVRGGYIEVTSGDVTADVVSDALQDWFARRAKVVFAERLLAVASGLKWLIALPPVRLRWLKRQWGSCSPQGLLTLNIHLVKASRESIDYVLLHELLHLKEHNHSRRFYRILDAELPTWRQIKTRLDDGAQDLLRA